MHKCDHCLIEIPDRQVIHERIDGEEKSFCCHGCMTIYKLIHDEGLEVFYERRKKEWKEGPPAERIINLSQFKPLIKPHDNEEEISFLVGDIRCASCIWLIENMLKKMHGVSHARINYATHSAIIRWNPWLTDIEKVLSRIAAIGYNPIPASSGELTQHFRQQQRELLIRFGTAAFFAMQLMMYSVALYAGYFQGIDTTTKYILQVISLILASPVLFYSGMPMIKGAISGLRQGALNMDVLIITGAGSAYCYSIYQILRGGEVYFDTSAMIITLILLGRYIESGAKSRASDVISRLVSLNPLEARVVVPEAESSSVDESGSDSGSINVTDSGKRSVKTKGISEIQEYDLVDIRPGERIPLDGIVIEGTSETDESMLTGESKPVKKSAGDEVFAGTFNLNGNLLFRVTRTGKDTVLSQIIKAVEDAQMRQAPVQALADKVVSVFVPSVLALSLATGIAWFVLDAGTTRAIMKSVAVLVIACPCALGLATPLAILTGTTMAAARGIMLKGGDIIERACNTDTIILDKTGTITMGMMQLDDCHGIEIRDDEALKLAASLEQFSEHSVARAIVSSFDGSLYPVTAFRAIPGQGTLGKLNGQSIRIGNRDFIEQDINRSIGDTVQSDMHDWIEIQESAGKTVIYMSVNGNLRGCFAVSDAIRNESATAVEEMKKMGMDIHMVTGDNERVAIHVAEQTGINKIRAGVSPVEKAEIVSSYQNNGRGVMMAGDGINDAPALIQADVGVAIGRATDIALESADIVLMHNDLMLLPLTLKLCQRTYRIIKQNLFWAFIYNIIALPLAATGMLHPIMAAGAMTLSSLTVVANSMRLRRVEI